MGSGVPWHGHAAGVDLFPLRPVANLPGNFHPAHPPIPHLRSLRLFPVTLHALPFSLFFHSSLYLLVGASSSLFIQVNSCCCRRFVGVVFGSKGTDAILSVEYYCCDRPNPILQVSYLYFIVMCLRK